MNKVYRYDVALSYAGEDRQYVDQVAKSLEANKIKVHYDRFNQAQTWGKDLAEHFDDIYRNQAQYCIMFISEHYAKKVWPSFEKRSALAREVIETGYILPARFDDTEVLGIPSSKAYIDLRSYSPEELAKFIIEKLGKLPYEIESSGNSSLRRPKLSKTFDPYKESQNWIDYLVKGLEKGCHDSGISFSSFLREGRRCLRFVVDGKPIYSIDIQLGGFHRDHGLTFSYAHGEMQMTSGYNAWADPEWDKEKEQVVLNLNDFSAYSRPSNERQNFTKQEFLDYMWEKVCNATEGKY